ncbi:hypothetical protein PTKIN_Ptkin13bG0290000 [Pterospermum kingtungense]
MEKPEAQVSKPRVVFLPFSAQGHVKPWLKLAELLSHASFQGGDQKAALCQLLVSLGGRNVGRQMQPTCIIADGIMSSYAIDVAEEFGIPVFVFRTYSACCTWTYFHLLKLIEEVEVPLQG